MADNVMKRSGKVAFYGVPSDGGEVVYTRMRGFTSSSTSKNPIEYNRKYVDEDAPRNDVVGYDTSMSYTFDRFSDDAVHMDIVDITDRELTGADAVRSIMVVDMDTKKAILRSYAVIPDSEGDDENAYTYSGNFKGNGTPEFGTATVSEDGQSATFVADSE